MGEKGHMSQLGAKAASGILCIVMLSACTSPLLEDTSRDLAKNVVNDVVQARFPGLTVLTIAGRPETSSCIAQNVLGSFLG